jgi:hypothetical protein
MRMSYSLIAEPGPGDGGVDHVTDNVPDALVVASHVAVTVISG